MDLTSVQLSKTDSDARGVKKSLKNRQRKFYFLKICWIIHIANLKSFNLIKGFRYLLFNQRNTQHHSHLIQP